MDNKIKWETIEQDGKFDMCANRGESVSRTQIGEIGGNKFIRFQVLEAYYNQSRRSMAYKVISQTVLPFTNQVEK